MEDPTRPITERVVRAVAAHSGSHPLELPPLYDTIDAEALEAGICASSGGELSFRYVGHVVTVSGDGTVEVSEPSEDARAGGAVTLD